MSLLSSPPQKLRYRDGTPADIATIDALFRQSFTATFGHLYAAEDLAAFLAKFTPHAWSQKWAEGGSFRLAEDDAGLAGYLSLGDVTLPAPAAAGAIELHQLYLADRAKGSGAAQALIDWAIVTARAGGASEMWLSVFVDNDRARRLYERYGFEDRGPYRFMVGSHADEDRLMRLAL